MKFRLMMRAACAVAALGAAGVFADTSPPKVTDVGPKPAEDRGSVGAIVLEDSLVRAQRENAAFARSSQRNGVESVGRNAVRDQLRQMGGPSQATWQPAPADPFNRAADGEIMIK